MKRTKEHLVKHMHREEWETDYRKMIAEMVGQIKNEEYIKAVYWFVKRLKD